MTNNSEERLFEEQAQVAQDVEIPLNLGAESDLEAQLDESSARLQPQQLISALDTSYSGNADQSLPAIEQDGDMQSIGEVQVQPSDSLDNNDADTTSGQAESLSSPSNDQETDVLQIDAVPPPPPPPISNDGDVEVDERSAPAEAHSIDETPSYPDLIQVSGQTTSEDYEDYQAGLAS